MYKNREPWKSLEVYKGKYFSGQWPTLPELFNITADKFSDRKCFSTYGPDLFFTYKEAHSKILSVSNYLKNIGVKKGDKVAVTGKNSPEWTIAYLSIMYAGATVVPLDYQLHSEEITALVDFSGVSILFVDEEKYEEIADLKKSLSLIALSPGKDNYILELADPGEIPGEMPVETDLAAILYTSGTTGNQKGVMLTQSNFVSDCFLAQGHMALTEKDVFYALLPLHHSYSMLAVFIEAISVGAEIVFAKKLVVTQILKDLKTGKVTMFLAIPMLFNKMLKALMNGIREKGLVVYGIIRFLMAVSGFIKKTTGINPGKKMFKGLLSKLSLDTNRICICGGGPLPASTFKMFNQLGIDFVQGYGLTETSPIIALNPVEHYKEASVGAVTPGTEMKILDPDETGSGEILVKGPMVMQGYYNNKEATDEIFTEDGWLKTGDVGFLDDENFLYLTGRKKTLIVTEGGKNVFPEEIEDHFQLFDEIEQVLVRGYVLDDKMKTEGIEALIFPNTEFQQKQFEKENMGYNKENIKKEFDKVIDQVNRELLPYKRITKLKILNEAMEMTTTKKIKRFKVSAD
jgi:long-chain acyl-CoA synthetase